MSEPVLAASHLSAVSDRDRAVILHDVSLEVRRGETRGLVGESGAGKSTIAKAILGILPRTVRITGGAVRFEGVDLMTMPTHARRRLIGEKIALIPQDPLTALNPSRRIEAQLTDGLRLQRGLDTRAARARGLALLDEVQIQAPERVLRSFPHELSGGMRQRVLIASAFALEPRLIVADEPTTALDVTVQKQILRLIRAMQSAHGTAVLFVTHDLGVVAQICDSVTLLFAGRVVEAGRTADLLTAPRRPYTRALIEASPRYDRPDAGLRPIPDEVVAGLRAELAASNQASP
ncbi:MAG TPA: ABC transporter ATP-binding protein [Roseiarcus sp.]|jgi:peptide/nickel transport system ATP-binding protein